MYTFSLFDFFFLGLGSWRRQAFQYSTSGGGLEVVRIEPTHPMGTYNVYHAGPTISKSHQSERSQQYSNDDVQRQSERLN